VLQYRDDGVVLRTQKLGEADHIVTLLCRHNGRIRAVAKGVRRTKSKFGGRLEPFTHVDVLVHPGRSLDVISQAEVIKPYGVPLAGDYPRYTAGTAMLETAERFTPMEKEPALRQYLLLIGGLRTLGETGPDAREPRLVLDAYLLRSLSVAGYAPALTECARCGAPDLPLPVPAADGLPAAPDGLPAAGGLPVPAPDGLPAAPPQPSRGKRLVAFAVQAGGMVCASCRPPGAASPSPHTVALMRALIQGDWDSAMRSEHRHRVECSGLVAAYLQWHLEHSIRSLRHVERA
jgi:DNA repair protein RecO (recombination protein O)